MEDLTGKTTGSQLTAAEFVQIPQELQNLITALGVGLSSGDLNQIGKAIIDYVGTGNFYNETSGVADVYTAFAIGSKHGPSNYYEGMEVRFRAGVASTATVPTIDINGLGAKDISNEDLSTLSAGQISATSDTILRFDFALDQFFIMNYIAAVAPINDLPRGYFSGFRHSWTNATDILVVSGGACRDRYPAGSEKGNTQNMIHTVAFGNVTKRANATWADGSGNGGVASGVSITSGNYYRYFCLSKLNGDVDFGWDTASDASVLLADSAVVAANYVTARQIAWHRGTGTGTLEEYFQQPSNPNRIIWANPSSTIIGGGTADQSVLAKAPPGTDAVVSIMGRFDEGPTIIPVYMRLSSLDDSTPGAPTKDDFTWFSTRQSQLGRVLGGPAIVKVNSSSQFRFRITHATYGTLNTPPNESVPRIVCGQYYYNPNEDI